MITMQVTDNGWLIIDVPGADSERLGLTRAVRRHWAIGVAMSALSPNVRPSSIVVHHFAPKRGISNEGFRVSLTFAPPLDAPHVPGTDYYDGRDGSLEDDSPVQPVIETPDPYSEPSDDNPWDSGYARAR